MAKVSKAKKTVDAEQRTVTFEFPDGGRFVAELDKMNDYMRTRLALHGIAQKLGDTYAGEVESPEAEVRGMFEELVAGEWSQRRPGEPRLGLIIEALSRMEDVTIDEAKEFWDTLSDEEKKTLRGDATVKAEVAKIAAERATKAAEAQQGTAEGVRSILGRLAKED